MGHFISVDCESCDFQESFMIGVGMAYFSLENVISQVSPNRRSKVKALLQRQDIHDIRYEHKIFVCPNCDHLAGRFDFFISYGDRQTYSPYFRCPDCRTRLVPLTEPITTLRCPECSQKSLVESTTGFWD